MKCDQPCQEFCSWIETLPHHVKYNISKQEISMLPECFKESFLGEYVNGAKRQFRGPSGAHVHEFSDRWVIHRDIVDAEQDPLGHLVMDAPEYVISMVLGAAIGIAAGRRGKDKALMAAGLTGALALASGKIIKMLNGDRDDGEKSAPKLS